MNAWVLILRRNYAALQLPRQKYLISFFFVICLTRWATRKSRLATLPGFKYFHLMRRVSLDGDGAEVDDDDKYNYVSFTIW